MEVTGKQIEPAIQIKIPSSIFNNKDDTLNVIKSLTLDEQKRLLDGKAKEIFSLRHVLVYLLKNTTNTFKNYPKYYLYNAMGCISNYEANIEKKSRSVDSVNPNIKSGDNKNLEFDVIFNIPVSDNENYLEFGKEYFDLCYVNVEIQNVQNPGYILEHRALAYFSRLINNEVNSYIGNDSYKFLRKVIGIWILPGSHKTEIKRYRIHEDTQGFNHSMNVLEIIFIYYDKDMIDTNDPEFVVFLKKLTSNVYGKDKSYLAEYIPMDDYLERSDSIMCELSEIVESKGYEKAVETLILNNYKALKDVTEVSKVSGLPEEDIIRILKKNKIL